jgi:hypothetical protein
MAQTFVLTAFSGYFIALYQRHKRPKGRIMFRYLFYFFFFGYFGPFFFRRSAHVPVR